MEHNLFPEIIANNKEVIRALWWNQPYASLMLHGKIETRKRHTNVRGKVLICACKRPYDYKEVIKISGSQTERINETLKVHHSTLPSGQAIAIGELVSCYPMTAMDDDRCFVAYKKAGFDHCENDEGNGCVGCAGDGKGDCNAVINPLLWCWKFENIQPIEPFEIQGKQGWSILTPEIINKIKILK